VAPKKHIEQDEVMIVNDSPGEECRIAILQNGHLEEIYTERTATATGVGNIYKGRVVNVEPAIQAAFIDYGKGVNGFLHISDLHPKYFPGEERTERVGKKIPRRDRPPMQAALRRGQEILVQVLKEGIGTKGPTLTSYLSIPGRLLVLMPDMDRVGVSRKVEDEEKRREMRQILDSLDLPEGFGFILRTAGYGKTKTELKRDAAYLLRLWKMMEKRIKSVGAPCELYTESDLLIRTIRDVLRSSIKSIVVDSPSAWQRASTFLRVASPRSAPTVIRYNRPAPIFHAFDIERQIDLIHSREVPLPSGGRLVIDQTEALVAIDVNSGRSRSARDSETNAYETNCEAADEICRQLRLRDLGGLIVNDLIDMRSAKHRKQIEERFQTLLKRDRAKATVLPISEFGMMEMTRQRMRPSIRKSHFMACPHCNGRGEIKVPEYVASDAARHVGYLLQFDRVKRVEIACSPRVASVLLSAKRRDLVRLEDAHAREGKRIDVRVSESIAVDRVDYYAYDDRNADIDIAKLPALQAPDLGELQREMGEAQAQPEQAVDEEDIQAQQGRRRRRAHPPADSAAIALAGDFDDLLDEFEEEIEEAEPIDVAASVDDGEPPEQRQSDERDQKRGRRGRRRRGREPHRDASDTSMPQIAISPEATSQQAIQEASTPLHGAAGNGGEGRRSRRRRRGRGGRGQPVDHAAATQPDQMPPQDDHPVRVHDLARELSVTSREVINRCEPEPAIHHLANALSTVSAEEAQTIRDIFNTDSPESAEQPQGSAELPEAAADGASLPAAAGRHPEQAFDKRARRRRGRRGGRGRGGKGGAQAAHITHPVAAVSNAQPAAHVEAAAKPAVSESGFSATGASEPDKMGRRSRRRRRGRRGGAQPMTQQSNGSSSQPNQSPTSAPSSLAAQSGSASSTTQSSKKKPRRALYRAGRVAVSSAARESAGPDE
jgi:ribonuclease E